MTKPMTLMHLDDDQLTKRVTTIGRVFPKTFQNYGADRVAYGVAVIDDGDVVVVDAYSLADPDPTVTQLRHVGWQCFDVRDESMLGGWKAASIFLTETDALVALVDELEDERRGLSRRITELRERIAANAVTESP